MAKLIFERAVHRNPDTGELESYWPEHWPIKYLAAECIAVGTPFFAASYMNDPSSLEGNKLQVAWLNTYTDTELVAAREAAGVSKGLIYIGVDPAAGGQGSDPDMMGLFCIEVIDNRGYCIDFHASRQKVDLQPAFIETWLDRHRPDLVVLEETAAEGFVGTAMRNQINNGKGTKWPFEVQKPQGARDKGGKERRLMAIAARWESGQIKIPGVFMGGQIVVDPRWDMFVQQWRSFPVGHDDLLDAAYWACYNGFSDVMAGSVVIGPEGHTSAEMKTGNFLPATDSHGRRVQPIGTRRPRQSFRYNRDR